MHSEERRGEVERKEGEHEIKKGAHTNNETEGARVQTERTYRNKKPTCNNVTNDSMNEGRRPERQK